MFSRKDDYAFFIKPVDPSLVPGYGDAVKQPMDFGTMTVKVEKGKYRSLEDFAVSATRDFKLCVSLMDSLDGPTFSYGKRETFQPSRLNLLH